MPTDEHRAARRVPRNPFVVAALALVLLTGCPSSHSTEDAGAPDAGTRCLAGRCDAGTQDAGTDASERRPDAGERRPDAGTDAAPSCDPQPETCNGVDDDCNGAIDDAPAATECSIHTTASCVDGACVLGDCEAGWADCDGDAANGCETEIETDPAACGACDHACTAGMACRDGVCDDERVVQVSAGVAHYCALRQSGEAVCWGLNGHGQLGTGDLADRLEPTRVATDLRFLSIQAFQDFSCGITVSGDLACWGQNDFGTLGDGTMSARSTPQIVPGLHDVVIVSSGAFGNCFTVALTSTGDVWGWGNNYYGQIGPDISYTSNITTPTIFTDRVISLGASTGSTCVLRGDGDLQCFGVQHDPATLDHSDRLTTLTVGQGQNCVLSDVGAVYCWGLNPYGEVGPFDCAACDTPQQIDLGEPVAQVAAGNGRTYAITRSGVLYGWGSWIGSPTPDARVGRVVGVATKFDTVCVLADNGAVWCWHGMRVGDGTDEFRLDPTLVGGLYPR